MYSFSIPRFASKELMNKHMGLAGRLGFAGNKDAASYHVLSFLLGAALPTALLFYLASDRVGEGLSSISPSSWGSSRTPTIQQLAGATDHTAPTSPTSQGQEVRTLAYIHRTVLFHARCMTLYRDPRSPNLQNWLSCYPESPPTTTGR